MSADTLFEKKGRERIHFHSKKRSREGVAGFVLSLIAAGIMLALCIWSAAAKGAAGLTVGIIGFGVMGLSALAFCLSLKGLKERDVYTKLPFAGLILSGALFVLLFCLYVTGIQF